jgi:hypothetical protein
MFVAPNIALWADYRCSLACRSGEAAITTGPDAQAGAAGTGKFTEQGGVLLVAILPAPTFGGAVARPNQPLTYCARITARELRCITTRDMGSATNAPPPRIAQLRLACMSWCLIVFANLGRR